MTTALQLPARAPHAVSPPAARRDAPQEGAVRRVPTGWLTLIGLVTLLGSTWQVSQLGWFESGDDVGYWLGVVGGSMMLLLLLYPLRKHVRVLHRWGKVKAWLWGHMLLGIGGPLLILLHCRFQASSLNAAAALYSMLVVAGSGVLGRFLYVRVNRGLVAERNALRDLREHNGLDGDRRSVLWFAPTVQAALDAFERDALDRATSAGRHWVRLLLVLPVRSWMLRLRVQHQARLALRQLAAEQGWDGTNLRRRQRVVRRAVVAYFTAVMRVALFAAWERLFALWHVAHIPFVFLLVIAGVVHVVAVHAY